jgi:ubiquinone/menaquinone biosynthesis C-methylase UbiE
MIGSIDPKAPYRVTRRAALFLLTPLLLYAGKARGNERAEKTEPEVDITSKASLVHLGSLDSFDLTEGGIEAARLLWQGLENDRPESIRAALDIYDRVIPRENYGGEYTALQWFGEYLLADPSERKRRLADPFTLEFFNFFADNDYAVLKEYLERKYKLEQIGDEDTSEGRDRRAYLEDFILFNNPRRENWEKTSEVIDALKIRKGETIADIGSGPGYYTFKFAELVGPKGRVLAIDTVDKHVNYVKKISQKHGFSNIEAINNKTDTIGVPSGRVDRAFMCSLYHVIYVTSTEEVREKFVESIRNALKPNGRLIIVDNALVRSRELPYHGPYIAKELIVGQLHYYGFRLVDEYAFVPQRYSLVFQKV